jgi:S-adenosylmethionine hydrolase
MITKKSIVIISDCKDVSYNEMRQTTRNYVSKFNKDNFEIEIEPLVPIINFSMVNAAFLVRLMAEVYPPGTIFMTIMGPTKSKTHRIFGETRSGHIFVGANSGIFSWLIKDFGLKCVYLFKEQKWISFGGKYVSSKITAQISCGKKYDEIGLPLPKNIRLNKIDIQPGMIVHVDNFGLMKIKQHPLKLKEGAKVDVYLNSTKKLEAVYAKRMMDYDDGRWVLYNGSSLGHMPELGRVRKDTSAKDLNAKVGDIITWRIKKQ